MHRPRLSGHCCETKTLASAGPAGYDSKTKVEAKRLTLRPSRGHSFTECRGLSQCRCYEADAKILASRPGEDKTLALALRPDEVSILSVRVDLGKMMFVYLHTLHIGHPL